jgi:histone deacetylase complex regulatory component SIN3
MASTQAQKALETFERFLASLDLESYQQKYRPIKTVEQDLPRELNPLPDLYEHYWKALEDNPSFLGFEEFFDHWWEKRLRPLDEFIRNPPDPFLQHPPGHQWKRVWLRIRPGWVCR